jgi:hypothetical protein
MVSLTNSSFSTNMARGGNGGNGGSAGGRGGNGGNGGASLSGGIHLSAGTLEVTNCTVGFNTAEDSMGGAGGAGRTRGNPGIGQPGQGGGVRNAGGTVNALNTLFGNNTATNHPEFSGNFASASHNLPGDGTGSNLLDGVNGNLVGSADMPIDPLLGPFGRQRRPDLHAHARPRESFAWRPFVLVVAG